jgi:transcriptional regulator with XRE-family HTH domain
VRPADLRTFRESLGLTQSQLADALGMHVNTVACMERGEKPISGRTVAALEMLGRLMPHAPS